MKKSVLAIDLGTKSGWAARDKTGAISSGSYNCKPSSSVNHGQKYIAFANFYQEKISQLKPSVVYFEQVCRHAGYMAAHAYGAYLGITQMVCSHSGIICVGLGVTEIKRAMTGKGNAKKEEIIQVARDLGFDPADDNEADALAILRLALFKED